MPIRQCRNVKEKYRRISFRDTRSSQYDPRAQRCDAVHHLGDISASENESESDIRRNRADCPDVPNFLVDNAADIGIYLRQKTCRLVSAVRIVLYDERAYLHSVRKRTVCADGGGVRLGNRLFGRAPGGVASDLACLGRKARVGAVDISGGRFDGLFARSPACRAFRPRPSGRCKVRGSRRVGDDFPHPRMSVVLAQNQERGRGARRRDRGSCCGFFGRRRFGTAQKDGLVCDGHFDVSGLLQKLLHGQFFELLYILSDVEIRRGCRNVADNAFRVPVFGGSRNSCGRAYRRQIRQAARNMVVDFGLRAVRARNAVRKPFLDDCAEHNHRADNIVGIFGNSRVRTGIASDENRSGVGNILRIRFRHRGNFVSRARENRRLHGHPVRLQTLLFFPALGRCGILPAEGQNPAGYEIETLTRQ